MVAPTRGISRSKPAGSSTPLTLATKVTLARIVGTPIFVGLMVYYILSLKRGDPAPGYRVAATVIFILVAVTDARDGYLARKRKEVSRLGRILDPLADKFLVLATLIVFTRPSLPASAAAAASQASGGS